MATCRVLWKWTKDLSRNTFAYPYRQQDFGRRICSIIRLLSFKKNPDFVRSRFKSYVVFHQQNMNSADCKAEFRVEKADLPRLTYSRSVPLQTEKYLWWFVGTVCAAETNKLTSYLSRFNVLQDQFLFWVWLQMKSWILFIKTTVISKQSGIEIYMY